MKVKYPDYTGLPKSISIGDAGGFPGIYVPQAGKGVGDIVLDPQKIAKAFAQAPGVETIAHELGHALQARHMTQQAYLDLYNNLAAKYWPRDFRQRLAKGGPFFHDDVELYYKHPLEAGARRAGETAMRAYRKFGDMASKLYSGGR